MMLPLSRRLVAFVLCLGLSVVTSRASIGGTVTNADRQPVAGASVVAYNADHKMLCFATTDGQGRFLLSSEKTARTAYLTVSLLGYSSQTVRVHDGQNELSVTLPYNKVELREVVVKAKPIHQDNDTTRYFVNAFADGHEKTVEDLLKKLPGIDVGDDGSISFKGKPISKILLDHTDMFGENYKTASRTLSPQIVGSVEAINHFQENRILHKVKRSDDVVLNLTLKNHQALQKPNGRVSVGGGFTDRYDLNANLLTLNNKVKLYDAASLSNVSGADLLSTDDLDNYAPLGEVDDYTHLFSDRDNIRYAERKSKSNSLNLVLQPTSSLTLNEQFIAQGNSNQSSNQETISYLVQDITHDRSTGLKNRPLTLNNNISLKWDADKNTLVELHNRALLDNSHTDNRFIDDGPADYRLRDRNTYLDNDLRVSHSLTDRSALIVEAENVLNDGRESFGYGAPTQLADCDAAISQTLKGTRLANSVSAKYLRRCRSWEYDLSLGYRHRDNKVSVAGATETDQRSDDREQLAYLQANATCSLGLLKIGTGALLGYWSQDMETTALGNRTFRRLKLMPQVTLDYELKHHHFSASCTYEPLSMDPTDYLTRHTDERQTTVSATSYAPHAADLTLSSAYVFTPTLSTLLMAMYDFTLSSHHFVYDYQLTPTQERAVPTWQMDERRHFALLSLSHYVDALRHGVKLTANYNAQQYHNIMDEGGTQAVTCATLAATALVRSSFAGPVNYVVGGRYLRSSYHRQWVGATHADSYSLFQELNLRWGRFLAKVALDEHFLGRDHDCYLFLTPDIQYSLPKRRVTFSLSAYNALNRKVINEMTLSDTYSREFRQAIVPAQYLLTVSFRY